MDQTIPTGLKFCKDCAHFKNRLCLSSQNWNGINLVTGERKRLMEFAENARESSSACGKSARWFAPNESSPEENSSEAPHIQVGDREQGQPSRRQVTGGDHTKEVA